MHIGLLGGIGPEATVHYYRKLVAMMAGEGRPLHATITHADVASGLARLERGDVAGEVASHAAHIRRLADAGAEVAVLTSLSAHMMEDEIAAAVPIPICSALTPLSDHVRREGYARIGVIGSLWAMESGMRGALEPAEPRAPADPELRRAIGRAYLEMAVARTASPDHLSLFRDAARTLASEGAEAILLGGTDLCIVAGHLDPGVPMIDVVEVHVAALRAVLAA